MRKRCRSAAKYVDSRAMLHGKSLSIFAVLSLCLGLLAGCSSTPDIDTSTPEGAYKLAEKYEAEAKDYKNKALKMLAEKENYIGHFYFIREHYESALGRYEGLLDKYPGLGYDAEALYGAAVSAYRIKELNKAKNYYRKLIS